MNIFKGVGVVLSIIAGAVLGVVLAGLAVYCAILYAIGLPFSEWRFY